MGGREDQLTLRTACLGKIVKSLAKLQKRTSRKSTGPDCRQLLLNEVGWSLVPSAQRNGSPESEGLHDFCPLIILAESKRALMTFALPPPELQHIAPEVMQVRSTARSPGRCTGVEDLTQ